MNSGKHALVVNPWITDFKLYDEWTHPVGLYSLISLLEHNNWEISMIDCLERDASQRARRFNTGPFVATQIEKPPLYCSIPRRYKRYGLPEMQFERLLNNVKSPDLIFVGSGMSYWYPGLMQTFDMLTMRFPDHSIIVGGTSALLIPELLRQTMPGVILFPGTLTDDLDTLRGLHPALRDLSSVNWTPSISTGLARQKSRGHAPLLTTVGCPFSCSYCISSFTRRRFTTRDHGQILVEMHDAIENHGVLDFALYDDAFLFDRETHFIPLMQQIIRDFGGIPRLHAPNGLHTRWIDSRIAQLMVAGGMKTIRLGYESGSTLHHRDTNGKTDREEIRHVVATLLAAGFAGNAIGVYVMGGLPQQRVGELIEECRFIGSLGVLVKPVFLSPVPKTPLFNDYVCSHPELITEPLWHNDTFFVTTIAGWDFETIEEIKRIVRGLNGITSKNVKNPDAAGKMSYFIE